MATLDASGTQTATIGTDHTLDNVNTPGTFVFQVDLSNMVAGDVVELRIKTITLTTGATTQEEYQVFWGVQDQPSVKSIPIPNDLSDSTSIQFTLKQTQGTGRQFPWKTMKL